MYLHMFQLWYSGGPDVGTNFLEYIYFYIFHLHPKRFEEWEYIKYCFLKEISLSLFFMLSHEGIHEQNALILLVFYWVLTVLRTALYTGKLEMNKRQEFCSFGAHVLLAGDGKGKALK